VHSHDAQCVVGYAPLPPAVRDNLHADRANGLTRVTLGRVTTGGPLFSFRMIPAIAQMLAAQRIDIQPLLRTTGLPDDALRGEVIAPLSRIQQFIDLAAQISNKPLFGIDLAEHVSSGTLGVTEFLMRSAPTVEGSIRMLCEYAPLINPILDFKLEVVDADARLRFVVPSQRDGLGRQLNEYTFALMFRQFAVVLGEPWPVERLWFAHERSDHRAEVAARFGCGVTFGDVDCGFSVQRPLLDRRPPTADPVLSDFLLAQAQAQIANLPTRDVISQVARAIEVRLGNADVTAEATAKAMATTVRSLQRHLGEAGTSYREVLMHVRQRRRAELTRAGIAEQEIARKLGFADAGSMRRSLDGSARRHAGP
jgi:AraC-like DNA-binding protein